MIGIKFTINGADINRLISVTNRIKLAMTGGIFGLMPAIGQLLETQHRRRVTSEKTSPDGDAWAPNIRGSSILFQSGALAAGFNASSTLFTVRMGPPGLPYALIQQVGGTMTGDPMVFNANGRLIMAERSEVPARPYMGISVQNWVEIKQLIDRHVSRGFGWL
jgi:phage gpG-like protein